MNLTQIIDTRRFGEWSRVDGERLAQHSFLGLVDG